MNMNLRTAHSFEYVSKNVFLHGSCYAADQANNLEYSSIWIGYTGSSWLEPFDGNDVMFDRHWQPVRWG